MYIYKLILTSETFLLAICTQIQQSYFHLFLDLCMFNSISIRLFTTIVQSARHIKDNNNCFYDGVLTNVIPHFY